MGNAQHFLYSLNSDENKEDDEVTVMQNLKRINKKLDREHCLDVHNTSGVLISKANEHLFFEVLVQKLLPVNIMNRMQVRERLSLRSFLPPQDQKLPLRLMIHLGKKSNCLYGKVVQGILCIF